MIKVHHLNNSRSQRILWLLEELGVDYEVVKYQRDSQTSLAPPELKAIHPLGKSPVITDGDLILAESGAIIEYLADTYGKGRLAPAPGTPERLRYSYWMHFAEGSAMTPFLLALYLGRVGEAAGPVLQHVGGQIVSLVDYLEAELAKAPYFVGKDLTAADIQMSFPVEIAAMRGLAGADRPHLAAFMSAIEARPAYKRALERGGPYQFARS